MNALVERVQFVELNGSKMFTKMYGNDSDKPTIIFDAGYGDYSKAWEKIVALLREDANLFVYDRFGVGQSDRCASPRTSLNMVNELHQVLETMKIQPPYIFVGHSFGGVNARLFATTFPKEVSGLVLVDSTPEDYRERFLPTMSQHFKEAYNKQFTLESSYEEFMESLGQLKDHQRHLGVIPMIVICAGKKHHYSEASQRLWNDMQREFLTLSHNSQFILAEESSHYIQDDDPEIVVDAIRSMIDWTEGEGNRPN